MFFLPSLISTGIGFLGQRMGANAAERNAEFNASMGKINAAFELDSELRAIQTERLASDIQFSEARVNHSLEIADAEARERNAEMLHLYANANTAESREEIRRRRLDFKRFQGSQRARVGASGVIEAGSPLEALAESAGQMELALNEMQRQASNEFNETMNQAAIESRDARLQRLLATQNLNGAAHAREVSRITSDMDATNAQYRYQSALNGYSADLSRSRDQARGMRLGSVGTLLSGTASWIGNRKTQPSYPYSWAQPVNQRTGTGIFR